MLAPRLKLRVLPVNTEDSSILFPALEQTFMAVVLVNENDEILFFNDAAEKLWGYEKQEVMGQNLNILIPRNLKPAHASYVHHNRQGGKSRVSGMNRELQLERKDGTFIWASFSLSKINVNGLIYYMASVRDVTQDVNRREENRLLLLAVNNTNRAVIVLDESRKILQINRAFTHMFGYAPDTAVNQYFPDILIDSLHKNKSQDHIVSQLGRDHSFHEDMLATSSNGKKIWTRLSVNSVTEDDVPKPSRNLVVVLTDITEERNIRELERDVLAAITSRLVFNEIGDYICRRIEHIAPGVFVSACRIINNKLYIWGAPGFSEEYYNQWNGITIGEGVASCGTCAARGEPVIVKNINTDPLWSGLTSLLPPEIQSCWSYPVLNRDGDVIGTFAFYFSTPDIPHSFLLKIIDTSVRLCALAIEREQGQQEIDRLIRFDRLTGLPNRQYLVHYLDNCLAESSPKSLLVFFLHINEFRKVNESLGYPAGDQVILTLANRLQEAGDRHNFVCRLSGAQFVVVASGCGTDKASPLVALLLKTLMAEMTVAGHTFTLLACIGISHSPAKNAETLLHCAENAMESARRNNENYQYYDPELNRAARKRVELRQAFRRALRAGELRLEYQPQICSESGEIYGFEALARWHDPDVGNISPAVFIPVAEETGDIEYMGNWAMREVCRQLSQWRAENVVVPAVSVNLSARSFSNPMLPQYIAALLTEYNLPGDALTVEITESAMMALTDEMPDRLQAIRKLGVGVSVDDFGTGFSSLSRLAYLPVTEVKIDKSFIDQFTHDRRVNALVEAVVHIGHNLDMVVVAEGVESISQRNSLKHMGCPVIQGYLFSGALPADTVTDWIRSFREKMEQQGLLN